jgi:hypothetical protein
MTTIIYQEKGQGLHDALAAHGYWLAEEYSGGSAQWVLHRKDNQAPTAEDYAAAQAIIDGYDQAGALRAAKIITVKQSAQDRIYAIVPDWKQANLTARALELQNNRAVNGLLTEEEQTELDGIQAIWDRIKALRERSNELEAYLAGVTSTESLAAFDVNAQDWPA